MRKTLIAIAVFGLFTAAAAAQDQPAQNGPNNAAVKSPDRNNAAAPVKGQNSFTMQEAKSAIEKRGYTDVSGLMLDANGVWRGTASKNGQSGPVSLDYQGNVN